MTQNTEEGKQSKWICSLHVYTISKNEEKLINMYGIYIYIYIYDLGDYKDLCRISSPTDYSST